MKWYIWLIVGLAALGLVVRILMTDTPDMLIVPDDYDVEALGRMINSENPRDSRIIQVGIAWAAKNEAARKHISVAKLLMPNGLPGPQSGRYASTVNPSSQASRSIAFDVLSGKESDPTSGATQFDAPHTQDILYAQGRYSKNADDVAASRISEGKEVVYLPGVDPNYMRWWRYS